MFGMDVFVFAPTALSTLFQDKRVIIDKKDKRRTIPIVHIQLNYITATSYCKMMNRFALIYEKSGQFAQMVLIHPLFRLLENVILLRATMRKRERLHRP
jgi:hypothetical protein